MTSQPQHPTILPPASPSQLLSHTISHFRHPATLLIGATKSQFLDALGRIHEDNNNANDSNHHLSQKTIHQTAVSRHIRTVFIPSVSHLRAYLSVWPPPASCSKVSAPPLPPTTTTTTTTTATAALPPLIVYGFLELHRATSEWSAQGIAASAACFVDAAARSGFRAVIVEPSSEEHDEGGDIGGVLGEMVPILKGTARRDDGTWAGRTVDIGRVLGRWFEVQEREW